jgi:hypothetical protein
MAYENASTDGMQKIYGEDPHTHAGASILIFTSANT